MTIVAHVKIYDLNTRNRPLCNCIDIDYNFFSPLNKCTNLSCMIAHVAPFDYLI